MRLTTVILLGTMLHLSAATFGQKLNYVNKNVSLEQLFKEIKKQTNYNVVWYEGKLNTTRTIDANFSNASLDQVMDKALSGLPLTYTIRQNNIVIKEKTPSFLDKVISHFKNTTLFGKVTDEKGNPLPGATIRIKDTKTAFLSNKDGNFSIESKETSGVLFISFLGYKPTEISFSPTNPGPFNITLKEDESILNEVQINAGYYTVSDRERTGSISKVTAETIGKQPVNNVLQALQGRVPGLQITQQTGVPGGGFTVQIRGQNSISNGNDPLYIVDGVTYPSTRISSSSVVGLLGTAGANSLNFINPYDIESVEVLKDADATAIYGSRGANGVILITTKKGKSELLKVNAELTQGFSQVGHFVDLLNTEQYVKMRQEAFRNDQLTPSSTDYDINGTWDQTKYTNWQKDLIGKNAPITNASLSISKAIDKNSYLIGGNYYKENTVFPNNDFGIKRASIHSTLNIGTSSDRLNATFTTNFAHTRMNMPRSDLTYLILLAPNAPDPFDQYNRLNWDNNTVYLNPMATLLETNESNTDNLVGNFTINYKLFKNLILKTSLGYTSIKRDELAKIPLTSFPPAFEPLPSDRESYFSNNYNNTWLVEPQINYTNKFGPGDFNALIGLSFQDNKTQLSTIKASGYNTDELMNNIASASTIIPFQSYFSQYRYTAIFARLNYNLFGKYFMNLTTRRDGSSRFGNGKQFANFGAIGSAWIFSEENFIKEHLPFLSFGKLRASYGITGNDQIPDYGYLQLWNSTSGTYQGVSTIAPTTNRLGNPDFSWETNKKMEVALQLGLFKDRITGEISFYNNRSSNQLVGVPLALSTGNSSIQANLPATVENYGWEFDLNFKMVNTQNWSWATSVNLAIPKNKLISYPGLEKSFNSINYIVGQPLSIREIYNVKGVDSQTGLYNIEDRNQNGVLDNADRYLNKFIGQYFYGGIQNSIHFKQFRLDLLFSFTKQNGNNYMRSISYSPGVWFANSPLSNQPTSVLERWQKIGDQSSLQKFSTSINSYIQFLNANGNGGLSIVDASYIRLKNLSFSYSLPKLWLNSLKISDAEITFQGQNLLTITNYIGLDPESQNLTNLPPLRTFTMGINITF
jgi:TonB-linked SusC/RagA family outer membrane protein